VVARLRCGCAVGERIARAGPGSRLHRPSEAVPAARRCAVRNALEDVDPVEDDAAHSPGRRVGDGASEIRGSNELQPGCEMHSCDEERRLLDEGSETLGMSHISLLSKINSAAGRSGFALSDRDWRDG